MRSIPEEWSDRIPQKISPQKQVMLFHHAFHAQLLEAGFVCQGGASPREDNALSLFQQCRYFRIQNSIILQTVECFLSRIDGIDGKLKKDMSTGGSIRIHVCSLDDSLPINNRAFFWGQGQLQQALVNYRFPNMPTEYSTSFIVAFCDDMAFAFNLEKELFFEQTLPWLDQHATPEQYADWTMKKLMSLPNTYRYAGTRYHYASEAIWSQLRIKRWENAEACIRLCLDHLKDCASRYRYSTAELPQMDRWTTLQRLIQHQDELLIDALLKDNRIANVTTLQRFAPALADQLILSLSR